MSIQVSRGWRTPPDEELKVESNKEQGGGNFFLLLTCYFQLRQGT